MKESEISSNLGKRVRLNYLTGGQPHAEGTLIGYYSDPTVLIETDDGRQIAWLAKITEPVES